MATKKKASTKGKAKSTDLVIRRTFRAPREDVWKAWTEPPRFKQWWGPRGYTIPSCEIDLRVGGKYLYCMRSPDGNDFWATGVYREIVPLEKLVSTDSFADKDGNVVSPNHYGMPKGTPTEMLVTVTFDDVKGGTALTLRHAGLPAGEGRDGAQQGWSESFDKLDEDLERRGLTTFAIERAKRRIVMSRTFDAPRDRVFRAYTDPKLIPQWWGLRDHKTVVDAMQVRKGGRWRYVQRAIDGTEYAFRGEYREIVPGKRLVSTFEFEGLPGHVVIDTATFEDDGDKTKVTVASDFDTVADLDGMLQSGMEGGARESWDRLDELLTKADTKRGA